MAIDRSEANKIIEQHRRLLNKLESYNKTEEQLKNDIKAAKDSIVDSVILNGWYDVEVTIKNTGSVDIEEVLQVYVKDLKSSYAVKNHSLCGIKRVKLAASEEKTVNLRVQGKAFVIYDNDGMRKVDSDSFKLYVGVSQPDEVSIDLGGVKPAEIILNI